MTHHYKFVLTLLTFLLLPIQASTQVEDPSDPLDHQGTLNNGVPFYPGQENDPLALARIRTFAEIHQTENELTIHLNGTTNHYELLELLEILDCYADEFFMYGEDGTGGMTQQAKYAALLYKRCVDQGLNIIGINLISIRDQGMEPTSEIYWKIGIFMEKHGINDEDNKPLCNIFFGLANQKKKQDEKTH